MNKKTTRLFSFGAAVALALSFSAIEASQPPNEEEKKEILEDKSSPTTESVPEKKEKAPEKKFSSFWFEDKKAQKEFMQKIIKVKALETEPFNLKALKFSKGAGEVFKWGIPVVALAKGGYDIYRGKGIFNWAMLTGFGTSITSFVYGTKRNTKFGSKVLEDKIKEKKGDFEDEKTAAIDALNNTVNGLNDEPGTAKIGPVMNDIIKAKCLLDCSVLKGEDFERFRTGLTAKVEALKKVCEEEEIELRGMNNE